MELILFTAALSSFLAVVVLARKCSRLGKRLDKINNILDGMLEARRERNNVVRHASESQALSLIKAVILGLYDGMENKHPKGGDGGGKTTEGEGL